MLLIGCVATIVTIRTQLYIIFETVQSTAYQKIALYQLFEITNRTSEDEWAIRRDKVRYQYRVPRLHLLYLVHGGCPAHCGTPKDKRVAQAITSDGAICEYNDEWAGDYDQGSSRGDIHIPFGGTWNGRSEFGVEG